MSLLGVRELHDDHLNKGIGGVDPFLVDAIHEQFSLQLLFVVLKDNAEGLGHLPDDIIIAVHDVSAECDDGLHDELDEAAGELGVAFHVVSDEGLLGRAEVVVAPKLLHELELFGVDAGESGEGEGSAEEGGTEGNRPVGRVDLLGLTHVIAILGGDDNFGVINETLEVLVHSLAIDLKFEDAAIDLVD